MSCTCVREGEGRSMWEWSVIYAFREPGMFTTHRKYFELFFVKLTGCYLFRQWPYNEPIKSTVVLLKFAGISQNLFLTAYPLHSFLSRDNPRLIVRNECYKLQVYKTHVYPTCCAGKRGVPSALTLPRLYVCLCLRAPRHVLHRLLRYARDVPS